MHDTPSPAQSRGPVASVGGFADRAARPHRSARHANPSQYPLDVSPLLPTTVTVNGREIEVEHPYKRRLVTVAYGDDPDPDAAEGWLREVADRVEEAAALAFDAKFQVVPSEWLDDVKEVLQAVAKDQLLRDQLLGTHGTRFEKSALGTIVDRALAEVEVIEDFR